MARQAGALIPLFSLRSRTSWGIGEIADLVPFARWAASAGLAIVQVLPVNEPSRGQNSPYHALTAFAIDPIYVAMEMVEDFAAAGGRDALPPEEEAMLAAARSSPSVRWEEVRVLKTRCLERAFRSFLEREWKHGSVRAGELRRYMSAHASWLDAYALFAALHDDRFQSRAWTEWDPPFRTRDPAALAVARTELTERILLRCYAQWQLDLQWHAARKAASGSGVELMGDLPFMVAGDSADVWSRPFDFRLDARAGVPPDAFSETGQDWGLPVYRWDVMAENGSAWMNERARRNADLFGLYRVDHVVGLYRTYYRTDDGSPPAFIPEEEPDQIANGEKVLAILSQGARVIAEDLGVVPDFVRESLARCAIPGYRVLRWEKDWEEDGEPFRDPARWPALSVATTGTHDTEPLAEWYDKLPDEERSALLELPGLEKLRARAPDRFDDGVRDELLSLVYGSGSDLVLLPFQDLFGMRERVNVPGTLNGENWTYRMPMEIAGLSADVAARERLRGLASSAGRLAP